MLPQHCCKDDLPKDGNWERSSFLGSSTQSVVLDFELQGPDFILYYRISAFIVHSLALYVGLKRSYESFQRVWILKWFEHN